VNRRFDIQVTSAEPALLRLKQSPKQQGLFCLPNFAFLAFFRAGDEIRNPSIIEKKQMKDFLQSVPEITRNAKRRKKMRKSD
jgi:hypothetical protein